jgi:hypothetical protein
VAETEPGARLACLTVLKTARIALEAGAGADEGNLRMRLLVKLKPWARPVEIGPGYVTHHVLEASDPAAAILELARANRVDRSSLLTRVRSRN